MLSVVIVAAGSSRRMGFDKLFALLDGKPVIAHTIEAFGLAQSVVEIIVVARADRLKEFEAVGVPSKKVRKTVAGGEHRQDSVRAGLAQLGDSIKYVAVHDAARPLVTPQQIERVFAQCRVHRAATAAEVIRDTLKRADKDLNVIDSVDRDQLYAMQTPQIFERNLLERAYREVFEKKLRVTDEVSAVERLGHKVMLVPDDDFNFKITYERDLRLAEFVLRERNK